MFNKDCLEQKNNNCLPWKQLIPKYGTTTKKGNFIQYMGKFITVHGERAQNFLKKEQPKKWKQLMRGGLETTRAEASNAEASHAEATNNYTKCACVFMKT